MSTDCWLIPPDQFGFDADRFPDWRRDQPDAVRAALEAETKHVGLVLPTGAGKSLTALAIARLTGWRTVYLTSTKALQDQIERDFSGLVTVLKGQAAYLCDALAPGGEFADWNLSGDPMGCNAGPCHAGKRCDRRGDEYTVPTCRYFKAVRSAARAPIVVTNYAAWLAHRIHAQGLGKTDCLILDEAHAAPDELAGALRVEIASRDLKDIDADQWPSRQDMNTAESWGLLKDWAGDIIVRLAAELDTHHAETAAEARYLLKAKRLHGALMRIAGSDPDITLVKSEYGKLTVEPVWAATYVDHLWKDIPHVICMSATVRPKTLELLGIGLPQTTWYETNGDFPVNRRPVYCLPLASVKHNWTSEQQQWWLSGIDDILRARPDVKGIIHTVSYARRNLILQRSEFRDRLLSHDRDDTAAVVERFKRMDGPRVLLSPSVTTGYDFPHDTCRFQIVGKVPFPDTRDPITERRTVLDPDYPAYVAMQELVQATGRGMRAKDDWCECVSPETRVLCADLTWERAESLRPGDALMTFDDMPVQGIRRRLRVGRVVRAFTRKMPRVRIDLDSGETLICTPNHPWLYLGRSQPSTRMHMWKRADELQVGDLLPRFFRVWDQSDDYQTGWLAGFADGEGCLVLRAGKRNPNVTGLYLSQNEGRVLARARKYLDELGFDFSVAERLRCRKIKLLGGSAEVMRFLGSVRPVRLLQKFEASERGEQLRRIENVRVTAVYALSDGPIRSMQTSTGTFIAEGFGAHNTFILDKNFLWFIRKYKSFAPKWFLQSVQTVDVIPRRPIW